MAIIITINKSALTEPKVSNLIKQQLIFEIPVKEDSSSVSIFCPDSLPGEALAQLELLAESAIPAHPKYPIINQQQHKQFSFECNGVIFSNESFNIIAGLNSVDSSDSVEQVFALLKSLGITTARMGAYKPRTNPYSFQGLGKSCLDEIFTLADRYGILLIAIEVRSEAELDEVLSTHACGNFKVKPIIQVGTRNAQNFELLKAIGKKCKFPVLYKRGYGITLEESICACEYIAMSGNDNIIFCLRGIKSFDLSQYRNYSDFGQLPILKREIKLPVCIDPSHCVGQKLSNDNNILDINHLSAQGVIAGANSVLIDIHPNPTKSPVDSGQVLDFKQFKDLVTDMRLVRKTYVERLKTYEVDITSTKAKAY